MQRTSQVRRRTNRRSVSERSRRGIVLLDAVLTLAVAALILLVVLPAIPRGTTTARQAGYAFEIAAMLKTDRSAAARTGGAVATRIEVANRRITSGFNGRQIVLPRDLMLDVLASDLCTINPATFAIVFAPDGRSCGAVIRVGKVDRNWRISINWLTGYVDVESPNRG